VFELPEEVLDAVAAAADRADALAAQGLELHFGLDAGPGTLRVEIRDLGGGTIRPISPAHALEVMAGASVDDGPPMLRA
jgi:hypothetical protein